MSNWTKRDLIDALKLAMWRDVYRAWLEDDDCTINDNLDKLDEMISVKDDGLEFTFTEKEQEDIKLTYKTLYETVSGALDEHGINRRENLQKQRESEGLPRITDAQIKEACEFLYAG